MFSFQDLLSGTGISSFGSAIGEIGSEGAQRFKDIFNGYSIDDNTLTQSQYDFRYRTFPEDLGNDYIGHYMVININVPVRSTGGAQRTDYTAGQTILDDFSKVDTLRFGNAEPLPLPTRGGPGGGALALTREPFSVPRYTRRIAESIAIFMPTPIVFNTTNRYQEISLAGIGTGMLASAAGFVGSALGGEALGSAASAFTQGAANISGLAGYPINPRVEVLFSKTDLRQYRMEFLLAPRNEKESMSMKAIIDTLRFHSVPELDRDTNGFTFIPPAEFDFTFYNKGIENVYIPRINTCVMDQIEVDFAPTGVYSTFTNGYPVMARLSMGVSEVEVLHKRRVLQGF